MTVMSLRWRVLIVTLVAVVGCSSSTTESSGAPPLVICGTTLWSGASGAVYTVATGRYVAVTSESSGDQIFLKLSRACQHGATISFSTEDAKIVTAALVKDGKMAAVAIRPLAKHFIVLVRRSGGPATTISVDLSALPQALSDLAGLTP